MFPLCCHDMKKKIINNVWLCVILVCTPEDVSTLKWFPLVFVTMNFNPESIHDHASLHCRNKKTTTYLSLQHVSLHAWSVLLGAVGPPNGETVRLALLFDLTGGCAVSTFNRHHSSVTSSYALPT